MKFSFKSRGSVSNYSYWRSEEVKKEVKEQVDDQVSDTVIDNSPVGRAVNAVQTVAIQAVSAVATTLGVSATLIASLGAGALITGLATVGVSSLATPDLAVITEDPEDIDEPDDTEDQTEEETDEEPQEDGAPDEVQELTLDPDYRKNILQDVISSIAANPSQSTPLTLATPVLSSTLSPNTSDGTLAADFRNFALANLCQ
jgi:hypothetical protein